MTFNIQISVLNYKMENETVVEVHCRCGLQTCLHVIIIYQGFFVIYSMT